MGWFWADSITPPTSLAPHPPPSPDVVPPPGCPMHKPTSTSPYPPRNSPQQPADASSCPIASPNAPLSSAAPESSTFSKFNPLNYMPSTISQSRSPNQKIDLPTSRTTSSIPRGDTETNWEYPSPQQMYNAMLRKGHDDTPEDAVESMVAVHNFLNEGAWAEIEGWEARFNKGLGHGWQICRKGEKSFQQVPEWNGDRPRLMRFMGRPGELTPKVWMMSVLGFVWPWYAIEPPFDRHDWYVQRTTAKGQTKEIRYVIDYYSGPPEPTGEPVFFLDVRPAVDSPTAAAERMLRWGGDIWYRASGVKAREKPS